MAVAWLGVTATPTIGRSRSGPRRTREDGVPEGEDAAVGGHQPVAVAVEGGAIPTTGLLRVWPPVEP